MSEEQWIGKRYRVLRRFSSSVACQRYEVRRVDDDHPRVVEMLRDELAQDPEMCERFRADAERAATLSHDGIASIEDVTRSATGVPYLVRRLGQGRLLSSVLGGRRFAVDVACEVGIQLLAALATAHDQEIVHGNLRPGCILVRWDDGQVPVVELSDFAPSLELFRSDPRHHSCYQRMCATGYASPEVTIGDKASDRSDLFSVAVLLYEMLSGVRLSEAYTQNEFFSAIAKEQLEPLARLNPGVPEPLARAVETCLALDPELRLRSARAFARQLAPYAMDVDRPSGRVLQEADLVNPASLINNPSLQLQQAPRPRRDAACPDRMLVNPSVPKLRTSSILESLQAEVTRPRVQRLDTTLPFEASLKHGTLDATGTTTALDSEYRAAVIAVCVGVGVGAILAWLSAVI